MFSHFTAGGPYLISCGDDHPMYLKVMEKTKQITVTYDPSEAEAFGVMTVSETLHHHELEFALTSPISCCKKRKRMMDEGDFHSTTDMQKRTTRRRRQYHWNI